tara:strand:+ start:13 stop:969 length:957 start_codon:yes stop_codon:yes gene_type:complete
MNIIKFKKVSIIQWVSIFIFFLIRGFSSDSSSYGYYYLSHNLSNFYQYAFEPGFSLLLAISSELNIPFKLFWIVCNSFAILTTFYFLFPNPSSKKISLYIFFSFLIVNILSVNLFSNLLRNALSFGITFFLINRKAKWYYFLIPFLFHFSSTILIFSHFLTNFFSNFKIKYVVLITLFAYIIAPIIGLFGREFIIEVISRLEIRSIINNLRTEYKPAYRYLSIILYAGVFGFLNMIYLSYKNNGFRDFEKITCFGISIKNLYTLCFWTIVSYPLYLSLLGFGEFSRLLTYQVWIGLLIVVYLFINFSKILIDYIYKSV